MRDGTAPRAADADLMTGLVAETDWQAIAPAAGGVGRFVYDAGTGLCEIDLTLRRLTGMFDAVAAFPAARFFERIHADDLARVEADLARAVGDGAPYEAEFRFRRDDGREVWLMGQGRVLTASNGRDLVVGVNHDVTERRRAQERAELLAGEMAHRMKNVLGLVQSMFNMAARSAPSKEALVDAFTGRLAAIASVNALVFAGEDRSVGMDELIRAVLGPLIDDGRVAAETEPFPLNSASAQTMVLVLNELMTNAVKHGALRGDDGTVAVRIRLDHEAPGGGSFHFTWQETGPGPVAAPTGRTGFGMRVLESMTAASFRGRPRFDWRPGGMRFDCEWPLGDFGSGNDALPTSG